jgi:putative tricarboxylic transport membrane protein
VADRVLAAGTIVLAAAYLLATWHLPAFDIGDPLGPKAFPYLLGGLLASAGVLLFSERHPPAAGRSPPKHLRAFLLVLAATGLLFALLEPLGYLVAISFYLFSLMHWLHGRRPAVCAVIAILFAIGSYALFAKGLGVTLAKGLVYF